MLACLAHRFGELGAIWRDVFPEGRRDVYNRGIQVQVAVSRQNDASLGQSRENRCNEVAAHLVLRQSSGLTLGIESLDTQTAQVIFAVVCRYITHFCGAVFVRGADDRVKRESIELVGLRSAAKQRPNAF